MSTRTHIPPVPSRRSFRKPSRAYTTDLGNDGCSGIVGRTHEGLVLYAGSGKPYAFNSPVLIGTGWGPLDVVL